MRLTRNVLYVTMLIKLYVITFLNFISGVFQNPKHPASNYGLGQVPVTTG